MQPLPFDRIAGRYDRVNDVLSLGLHRAWKEELANQLLVRHGNIDADVLDVATGTGDVAMLFVDRKMRRVIGLDPCAEMLQLARERNGNAVEWLQGNSETIPLPRSSVDLISCAFGVRNFSNRSRAFSEWRRVLRPGGMAGILEIHPVPDVALLRPVDWYWKHVVPPIGRLFGDEAAYAYLRDSAAAFLSPQGLEEELKSAGFQKLSQTLLFACGMVSFALFQRDGIASKLNGRGTRVL